MVFLAAVPARAADDPLESFNRAMFRFNEGLITRVIEPTSTHFGRRLPHQIQDGLSNIYSNFTEIEFLLNNLLRGDMAGAGISVFRFTFNGTFGMLGFWDVASAFGVRRREHEFGESLCRAGVPPGAYLVLPFVGPSNVISAGLLASGIAIEVYLLSFISTMLATLDFFIIDLGGSASALRHATDIPQGEGGDLYALQRAEYLAYIEKSCAPAGRTVGGPLVAGGAASPG